MFELQYKYKLLIPIYLQQTPQSVKMVLISVICITTKPEFSRNFAATNNDIYMTTSLIAFYSRKGQNYVNGKIMDLAVGNTAVIAKKIQEITGSDIFEIDTVKSYPVDYTETTRVAKAELNADARPELVDKVENMSQYDTIYLGFPNWWGTFPMAVFTFLESYDFSGKTIIPFCTHEGSGMGGQSDIRELCPNSRLEKGIAIKGSAVHSADDILKNRISK